MTRPAVLLVFFRRPELTRQVFEALRRDQPPRLYLAADGPRPGVAGERELCDQTRAVVGAVDWPCEVKTFFRDENVGVRRGVSEAISWFFDHEEEGVIFEDDCVPGPEFLDFCAENLERYRHDSRVLQISGTNFQPGRRTAYGHFFSRYNHVWGWATWRRAWRLYRPELDRLDEFLRLAHETAFWDSAKEQKYWRYIFGRLARGEVESWAYRWQYSVWAEGGLCVYPEASLVLNLGFGGAATNTREGNSMTANRSIEPRVSREPFPVLARHRPADRHTFERMYWGTPAERTRARWRRLLRRLGALR